MTDQPPASPTPQPLSAVPGSAAPGTAAPGSLPATVAPASKAPAGSPPLVAPASSAASRAADSSAADSSAADSSAADSSAADGSASPVPVPDPPAPTAAGAAAGTWTPQVLAALPAGVVLRRLAGDDAPALTEAYQRNRAHLAPYEPDRPDSFYTVAGQQARINRLLGQAEAGEALPCVLVRDGRVLGCATLREIVRGPLCDAALGYWVDAGVLRQGLAAAAVAALCRFADEDLRLHRIVAGTAPANLASQNVLKRNGFEQFGYAHKHLFVGGRWTDAAMFEKILNDRPPPAS